MVWMKEVAKDGPKHETLRIRLFQVAYLKYVEEVQEEEYEHFGWSFRIRVSRCFCPTCINITLQSEKN